MSTDRRELEDLQARIRAAVGYRGACTFTIDASGWIDGVFYKGKFWSPIAFAEQAREDFAKQRENPPRFRCPDCKGPLSVADLTDPAFAVASRCQTCMGSGYVSTEPSKKGA